MPSATTVYVSIGNSDDRLTQSRWAQYIRRVDLLLGAHGKIHGNWRSRSDDPYQNACWCVEFVDLAAHDAWEMADRTKRSLREIAGHFGQDSIMWATAVTELLEAT